MPRQRHRDIGWDSARARASDRQAASFGVDRDGRRHVADTKPAFVPLDHRGTREVVHAGIHDDARSRNRPATAELRVAHA